MFEIGWSELLMLGIVILVFVGPKELPVFMRTIGKYAGVVRRHANDFKAQFDAAMREAELDSMREEVDKMQASINNEVMRGKSSVEDAAKIASPEAAVSRPAVTPNAVGGAGGSVAPPMPSPPGQEA